MAHRVTSSHHGGYPHTGHVSFSLPKLHPKYTQGSQESYSHHATKCTVTRPPLHPPSNSPVATHKSGARVEGDEKAHQTFQKSAYRSESASRWSTSDTQATPLFSLLPPPALRSSQQNAAKHLIRPSTAPAVSQPPKAPVLSSAQATFEPPPLLLPERCANATPLAPTFVFTSTPTPHHAGNIFAP
jgi:hypothetical protein